MGCDAMWSGKVLTRFWSIHGSYVPGRYRFRGTLSLTSGKLHDFT